MPSRCSYVFLFCLCLNVYNSAFIFSDSSLACELADEPPTLIKEELLPVAAQVKKTAYIYVLYLPVLHWYNTTVTLLSNVIAAI